MFAAAVHRSNQQRGPDILEIGCGTGGSAIWLAKQQFRVTAVDIIPDALRQAAAAAAAAGLQDSNPRFLLHDVMQLQDLSPAGFDMLYDCQVYHALVNSSPDAQRRLPQLLYDQVKPGGYLFMLTGNATSLKSGPVCHSRAAFGATALRGV